MSTHIGEPQDSYIEEIPQDERRFTRMGWLVVGIGLFGFLAWAAFAPLDKGVASPGSVTVSGNRKTVQAPASGIIKNIAVKDGDKVKAGEVLVQLSQVQAQAQVDSPARPVLHHAGHRRAFTRRARRSEQRHFFPLFLPRSKLSRAWLKSSRCKRSCSPPPPGAAK